MTTTSNSKKAAQGMPNRQNRRARAVQAMVEHYSVERAAEAAGINPSTLWRWLKQPAFEAEVRQARHRAFGQSTARLQQGMEGATVVLFRVMSDSNAKDGARVQAAKCVLAEARKSVELDDLQQRVAAVEKKQDEITRKRN
jgi:transposase-like protein